jgi:hypothetical protein
MSGYLETAVALPPLAARPSSHAPSGPVAGQGSVLGLAWPIWPDVAVPFRTMTLSVAIHITQVVRIRQTSLATRCQDELK